MRQWKSSSRSQQTRLGLLVLTTMALLVTPTIARGTALRELSTDRPDATESPFTVDTGHWQLEMDLLSHTRNRLAGVRTRTWDFAPFNLRFGVSDSVEAGIFISPYSRVVEEPSGGARTKQSGFGDIVVRTKFNFAGNDGSGSACGLIVDLSLPTAATGLGEGHVGGDLILPFATELPGGWELGAMTAVELRHQEGGGLKEIWINTATMGHALGRNVAGYIEFTSATGEGAHVATFNFGLALKLDADTQLDAGANLGISRTADDVQLFAGVSRRF